MTILQRDQSRFDVLDRYGSLVAICKSQNAAEAFLTAWRPARPGHEPHRKHAAWRPKRVRS